LLLAYLAAVSNGDVTVNAG